MIVALLASLIVSSSADREANLTLPPPPAPALAAPAPARLELPLKSVAPVATEACADGAPRAFGPGGAGTQASAVGLGSALSERRAVLTLLRFGPSSTQPVRPTWDTSQVTCRFQ